MTYDELFNESETAESLRRRQPYYLQSFPQGYIPKQSGRSVTELRAEYQDDHCRDCDCDDSQDRDQGRTQGHNSLNDTYTREAPRGSRLKVPRGPYRFDTERDGLI